MSDHNESLWDKAKNALGMGDNKDRHESDTTDGEWGTRDDEPAGVGAGTIGGERTAGEPYGSRDTTAYGSDDQLDDEERVTRI